MTRLAFGVESPADLRATEGAVVQQSAIVAGEGHTLGHTLVNDVAANFGQTIHIGLTGAVVAALDGVAEEAFHTVAVVLVVFGRVDTALGSDAMGAAWRVGDAEDLDIEA